MSFDELTFRENLKQVTSEQRQQQQLAQEFYRKALAIKGVQGMDKQQDSPVRQPDAPSAP